MQVFLTVDGGMKPNRFICADKLAGITEFSELRLKVLSCCPFKPASKYYNDSQFCDIIYQTEFDKLQERNG